MLFTCSIPLHPNSYARVSKAITGDNNGKNAVATRPTAPTANATNNNIAKTTCFHLLEF